MSKICYICGKQPIFGNNVSHAHNKTKRRWDPNLHKMRIIEDGQVRAVKMCTSCLKKGNYQKAS